MKSTPHDTAPTPAPARPTPARRLGPGTPGRLLAAACTGMLSLSAGAFVDDFSDANDTGWSHYSPLAAFGAGATFTFPDGGYRLLAPASPAPELLGVQRAGSVRPELTYSRARIAVDITRWNTNINQSVGLIAHAGDIGLGTTRGYTYNYNSFSGYHQINLVVGEAAARAIHETPFKLDPAQSYRLVFTLAGNLLLGQAYASTNLAVPLHSVFGQDETHPSGTAGVFAFSLNALTGIEARFDNYESTAAPDTVRATVLNLTPKPGQLPDAPIETVSAELVDLETFIRPDSIQLEVDGTTVGPIRRDTAGAVTMVSWSPTSGLAPDKFHSARLTFTDDQGPQSFTWTFGTPEVATGPTLLASAQPEGPYTPEPGALHDAAGHHFSVPIPATPRFYRTLDSIARKLEVSLSDATSGRLHIQYR